MLSRTSSRVAAPAVWRLAMFQLTAAASWLPGCWRARRQQLHCAMVSCGVVVLCDCSGAGALTKQQSLVISAGLATVIPAAALPLLTWREAELLVCGRSEIDVDLLQRNTEYDEDGKNASTMVHAPPFFCVALWLTVGTQPAASSSVSPSDPHIQSFWRVLRGFDSEQRQQFLRFVWARSRLPPTAAEFTQKFKVQAALAESVRCDNCLLVVGCWLMVMHGLPHTSLF